MTLLISRVMKYLEDHDAAPSMLCRVYLRYIEHIYYKVSRYYTVHTMRLNVFEFEARP